MSGGNGILQTEQRVAPWYSIKCGWRLSLGTVETLADGFRLGVFLATFRFQFIAFAGTISRHLHFLVYFLKRVNVGFVCHASSVRRCVRPARAADSKLHHYPVWTVHRTDSDPYAFTVLYARTDLCLSAVAHSVPLGLSDTASWGTLGTLVSSTSL